MTIICGIEGKRYLKDKIWKRLINQDIVLSVAQSSPLLWPNVV